MPRSEPSLDVMADAVLELLDHLGIDGVVLAGLSMGGYVAMALLRRAPERISALVLADTKGYRGHRGGRGEPPGGGRCGGDCRLHGGDRGRDC